MQNVFLKNSEISQKTHTVLYMLYRDPSFVRKLKFSFLEFQGPTVLAFFFDCLEQGAACIRMGHLFWASFFVLELA